MGPHYQASPRRRPLPYYPFARYERGGAQASPAPDPQPVPGPFLADELHEAPVAPDLASPRRQPLPYYQSPRYELGGVPAASSTDQQPARYAFLRDELAGAPAAPTPDPQPVSNQFLRDELGGTPASPPPYPQPANHPFLPNNLGGAPAAPPRDQQPAFHAFLRDELGGPPAAPGPDPQPAPKPSEDVATLAVVLGPFIVLWSSSDDWDQQPRVLAGADPQLVPAPFEGLQMDLRGLPGARQADFGEEREYELCHICGVPLISPVAHFRGELHKEKAWWACR